MKNKKLKLLILIKTVDGGTGTFLLSFLDIKKMYPANIAITTAVLEKPTYRKNLPKEFIYWRNESFYPHIYNGSIKQLLMFFREAIWLYQIIIKTEPDIVLTVDTHCMLLTEIVKKIFGFKFKTISTLHNNIEAVMSMKATFPIRFILKKLVGYLLNNSNKVICISKSLSTSYKKYFNLKKNPKTIYYGLDLPIVKKYKEFPKNKSFKIVSIGRFAIQKDFITLIRCFVKVLEIYPNSKLYIAGGGPDKKMLTKAIAKLKLKKSVKLLPWQQNSVKFLKTKNLFVLSSKWEGFGLVLLEAMSQGLPIVSTNSNYGPSEVLENGKSGVIVPVSEHQKMSEAILKLLDNKKYYESYSKASLERSRYFTKEKMLKKFWYILSFLN